MLEYLIEIVALARRTRAQVAAPGAQRQAHVVDRRQFRQGAGVGFRCVALFSGQAASAQFDQAQLNVID